MIRLDVYIEIKGDQIKAGEITGETSEDAVFTYDQGYVLSSSGRALSVGLPLQRKAFSPERTRSFFSGLLPEGFMRKRVSELAHVSASDYIGVLSDLGSECIGAIKVIDPEMKRVKPAYIELTEEEIADIAGEGVIEASELVMKAHLSLAGASGKVGLYYEPKTSTWYIPVGEAPSTHIVKQSHVRLDGIVTNEQLCLLAAERLGIEVPQSFIVDTGGHKDSHGVRCKIRLQQRRPQAGKRGES